MLSETLSGREDTEYGKLRVTKLAFGMDNGFTIACFFRLPFTNLGQNVIYLLDNKLQTKIVFQLLIRIKFLI